MLPNGEAHADLARPRSHRDRRDDPGWAADAEGGRDTVERDAVRIAEVDAEDRDRRADASVHRAERVDDRRPRRARPVDPELAGEDVPAGGIVRREGDLRDRARGGRVEAEVLRGDDPTVRAHHDRAGRGPVLGRRGDRPRATGIRVAVQVEGLRVGRERQDLKARVESGDVVDVPGVGGRPAPGHRGVEDELRHVEPEDSTARSRHGADGATGVVPVRPEGGHRVAAQGGGRVARPGAAVEEDPVRRAGRRWQRGDDEGERGCAHREPTETRSDGHRPLSTSGRGEWRLSLDRRAGAARGQRPSPIWTAPSASGLPAPGALRADGPSALEPRRAVVRG